MGRSSTDDIRQLNPESIIIHQDKNGQKCAALSSDECVRNHKYAAKGTQRAYRDLRVSSQGTHCALVLRHA